MPSCSAADKSWFVLSCVVSYHIKIIDHMLEKLNPVQFPVPEEKSDDSAITIRPESSPSLPSGNPSDIDLPYECDKEGCSKRFGSPRARQQHERRRHHCRQSNTHA